MAGVRLYARGKIEAQSRRERVLEAATRVNTLENVRIASDYKVEQVIHDIVNLNFDLYKRITDDPALGRWSRIISSTGTSGCTSLPRGREID